MTRIASLAVAALLLASCTVDNRSSIEILGRAAPDSATSCKFSPSGLRVAGPGTLDVRYPRLAYATMVYVQNNMSDPTATTPGTVKDAKAWRATAVRVRMNPESYVDRYGASPALLDLHGTEVIPLDGQVVLPGGGSAAQYLDLISHDVGAALSAALPAAATAGGVRPTRSIVLGVALEGETLDGAKLVTGDWYFPLEVCDGCLVDPAIGFPPACATGTLQANNCFGLGQDTTPSCGG